MKKIDPLTVALIALFGMALLLGYQFGQLLKAIASLAIERCK